MLPCLILTCSGVFHFSFLSVLTISPFFAFSNFSLYIFPLPSTFLLPISHFHFCLLYFPMQPTRREMNSSVCPPVRPSICPSVRPTVRLPICPSGPSLRPSVRPSKLLCISLRTVSGTRPRWSSHQNSFSSSLDSCLYILLKQETIK